MNLILDFVLVSGMVFIMIILFLLIQQKEQKLPQKILVLFFVLVLFITTFFYALSHYIIWLIRLSFVPNDISFLVIGPLLFLYVKSLFLEEKKLVRRTLIHFIPAAVYAIGVAIPTLLYDIFKNDTLAYVVSENIYIFLRLGDVHFIVYLIISLRLLAKYRKLTKNTQANVTAYDFNWIKIMLRGALYIVIFNLIIDVYESFYGNFEWNFEYLSVMSMIILIVYLGYYGVYQSKVLLPDFLLENSKVITSASSKKRILTNIQKEEFEVLENRLNHILKTNKPYLDEDLTLNKLAKELDTTDKKLSALLNQYMDTTFYDLINTYRVAEMKEKMQSELYRNYTLLAISYECGFKSKTSFNRIFKKEMGCSPSVYRKTFSK